MPFALPEYDVAFARFIGDVVRELARARDPLLAMVRFEETSMALGTRIQDREGADVDLPGTTTEFEMSTGVADVRNGNLEPLTVQADRAADEYARQLVKHFVSTMDKVTEATGNVVDAGGKPMTFDKFYEMLDQMEW